MYFLVHFYRRYLRLFWGAVILILVFSSQSCQSCKSKPNSPSKLKPVTISNVRIYLDASESNKGYYKKTFSGTVTELLTTLTTKSSVLDSNPKINTEVFYIDDSKIDSYATGPFAVKKFTDEIGTRNNVNGKSSVIDEFFERIMKETDTSTISILISDCILSYPSEILERDVTRMKNKESADKGELKNRMKISISSEFRPEKKPAFEVFAYLSDFNGRYFDYKDHPKTVNLKNRPFYIWVLAKNKELLARFNKDVMTAENLKWVQKMEFGLTEEGYQEISLMGKFKGDGTWSPDIKNKGIRRINTSKSRMPVFTVGVHLPFITDSIHLINARIKGASAHGTKFNSRFLDKSNITLKEKQTLQSDDIKTSFDHDSHLLQISIEEMLPDIDTLYIRIPYTYPTWESDWSTHDDLGAKGIENRTFAFDQIVKAFKETLEDDKKYIVNIKIPISK